MRVTTNLSQQLGIKAILNQQEKLTNTQFQIASGLRLLTPSDDPAASVRILDLNESIDETNQFISNIQTAESRLSLEEVTLANATNVLQRLRELAVQAPNDSLTANARQGLEEEARQLLDELIGIANTQSSNGEYLFSGYNSQTIPFTGNANTAPGGFGYAGDTNQRNLQIGATRFIADGNHGISVFGDPSASTSAFDAIAQFADNISVAVNTPDPNDIDAIDAALERVLTIRANVGGRLNALDQQKELNLDLVLDVESTLSEIRDLDFAEAVGRLNIQTTALQAAQQAYIRVQGLSLFNYL